MDPCLLVCPKLGSGATRDGLCLPTSINNKKVPQTHAQRPI